MISALGAIYAEAAMRGVRPARVRIILPSALPKTLENF
jgi:hypothetical protein